MWREEVGITEMLFTYIGEYQAFCGWSSWRNVVIDILTCHEAVRVQRIASACGSVSGGELGIEIEKERVNEEGEGGTVQRDDGGAGDERDAEKTVKEEDLAEAEIFDLVLEGGDWQTEAKAKKALAWPSHADVTPGDAAEACWKLDGPVSSAMDETGCESKAESSASTTVTDNCRLSVGKDGDTSTQSKNIDGDGAVPPLLPDHPSDMRRAMSTTFQAQNQESLLMGMLKPLQQRLKKDSTVDIQNLAPDSFLLPKGQSNISATVFSCGFCAKMFNTISNKMLHERCHSSDSSHSYSKSFSHTRRKKTGPYVCNFCSKLFAQKCQKIIHERIHTGEKPFSCSFCSKSFTQNCDKLRHERCHTGERPYSCSFCSKSFTQRGHQVEHERIHTGEKRFSCSYCSKSFTYKFSKTKHELLHSYGKPKTTHPFYQPSQENGNP